MTLRFVLMRIIPLMLLFLGLSVSVAGAGIQDDLASLGLKEGASQAEVKRAFRKLVMKKHPDHGGTKEAFVELNNAYQRLNAYFDTGTYPEPPETQPRPRWAQAAPPPSMTKEEIRREIDKLHGPDRLSAMDKLTDFPIQQAIARDAKSAEAYLDALKRMTEDAPAPAYSRGKNAVAAAPISEDFAVRFLKLVASADVHALNRDTGLQVQLTGWQDIELRSEAEKIAMRSALPLFVERLGLSNDGIADLLRKAHYQFPHIDEDDVVKLSSCHDFVRALIKSGRIKSYRDFRDMEQLLEGFFPEGGASRRSALLSDLANLGDHLEEPEVRAFLGRLNGQELRELHDLLVPPYTRTSRSLAFLEASLRANRNLSREGLRELFLNYGKKPPLYEGYGHKGNNMWGDIYLKEEAYWAKAADIARKNPEAFAAAGFSKAEMQALWSSKDPLPAQILRRCQSFFTGVAKGK